MSLKITRHKDGRAHVRVGAQVAALIAGDLDISQVDDEELIRGQLRSRDGNFRGSPPVIVPRALYAEWVRREMETGFQSMIGDLGQIVQSVVGIAGDESLPANVRLKAAEMVMDRVYGKVRQHVELDLGEKPKHEAVIEEATIDRSPEGWGNPEEDAIVDAELVSEDDDLNDLDEWDD
jgi:hypothetical protein